MALPFSAVWAVRGPCLTSTSQHSPGLFTAIKNRDLKEMSSLLKKGACWDLTDSYGQTVLHAAVKKRCSEPNEQIKVITILNRFLKHKSLKVNVKCDAGRTPLHLAAKSGMIEVVDYLIREGANLNAKDHRGNGIVHYMVDGDFDRYFELSRKLSSPAQLQPFYRESEKFFHEMFSKNIEIDCVNANLDTPLHVAVRRNLLHIIPILIKHTRDVTLRDKKQQNILHMFIENKYCGTFKAMANSCYNKSFMIDVFEKMLSKGFSLSAADIHGNTPLHSAVYQEKTEFIKLMLENINSMNGNTIMHFIIDNCIDSNSKEHKEEYVEFVRILLSKGAKIDKPDKYGYKPVHLAVKRVCPTILQILKDHDADFKEPYNGGNLLHLLSENSSRIVSSSKLKEVVGLLTSQGCYVNAEDVDGMTPLHLAVKAGRIDVVKGLIRYHANVNARESSLRRLTPLQLAAVDDHELIINVLVEAGADINAKDSSGKTALHRAMSLKTGMVKTLLRLGAHVEVEDDEKLLPLHYAIKERNGVALAELLKFGADIDDIDTYPDLAYLSKPGIIFSAVVDHWVKMKAAGLSIIAQEYEIYASDDAYQKLYLDCLKEVENLKAYKIGDRTSLYGLLKMDPNFRCSYTSNKPFVDLIESTTLEQKFPQYHVLILASYHEAVARQPLLEPAQCAWREFTKIMLPDLCIYRILAHLRNRDLRVMVDGLNDGSFRKSSNPLLNETGHDLNT